MVADGEQRRRPLGILSFEAAAAMSSLADLHRTLAEPELLRLRSHTMRSAGVAYLNSTDQSLLLRLANAEVMDDLDRAAATVSRLATRCCHALPRRFDLLYADVKDGASSADLERLGHCCTKRAVKKMEKYAAATSKLCEEMEALAGLEALERRMVQQWRRYSGPIPAKKVPTASADDLALELKVRRQRVKRLRAASLWSQSADKAVKLMARVVFSVFARARVVFAPAVGNARSSSGRLERRPATDLATTHHSCPILRADRWTPMLEAPPHTLGGAGLASRYAEVIVSAERLLAMRLTAEAEVREELYGMLPAGLRAAVKGKLRDSWRERGAVDGRLAAGWREAVGRIMAWLAPLAHDTLKWQAARSLDRRRRCGDEPRALALQTLVFSDREKAEAAVVEVLVGLSCACWYEERRREGQCAAS